MKVKEFKTYQEYWNYQALLENEAREMTDPHERLNYTLSLFYGFIIKGRVLDVGCRDGWSTEQLKTKGFDSVGIDLSPIMVEYAKGVGRNVYERDMSNTKFKDNEFDGIFCVHSLEHSRNAELTLREFYRITRDGGVICLEVPTQIVESYKHISCWGSLEEFENYVKKSIKIEILESRLSKYGGLQGPNMIIIGKVMK